METAVKENSVITDEARIRSGRGGIKPSAIGAAWYRLTHWETWDWRIKYVVISPAWLWLCLRSRSFWFFTASNPTLTFGGFDGESKKEMYDQLPPGTYPKSIYISHTRPFREVSEQISTNGFTFPFAVKPDVGKMGLMFRKICSMADLEKYHSQIKRDYITQEWIEYPIEVSVFYYRMPGSPGGNISGFIRKDFLEVTGDGKSTLWELILKYPRARFRLDECRNKHSAKLNTILAAGEKFCLSPALNLSRGGKLVSLEREKDERLLKVFDDLSRFTGSFYYGRYDIKCQSVEDLKSARNFSILEFNGSGAEPHHVYGNGYGFLEACSILVTHWNILYKISQANNRLGIKYWRFGRGWSFLKNAGRHAQELRQLDAGNQVS